MNLINLRRQQLAGQQEPFPHNFPRIQTDDTDQ